MHWNRSTAQLASPKPTSTSTSSSPPPLTDGVSSSASSSSSPSLASDDDAFSYAASRSDFDDFTFASTSFTSYSSTPSFSSTFLASTSKSSHSHRILAPIKVEAEDDPWQYIDPTMFSPSTEEVEQEEMKKARAAATSKEAAHALAQSTSRSPKRRRGLEMLGAADLEVHSASSPKRQRRSSFSL
jgi:hypothetical protein